MIKIELIETAHLKHPQLPARAIEQFCGRVFNKIIYQTFRLDSSNLDLYCKEYTGIGVSYDEATDTYYITLPEQIVQLPDQAEGVRRINRMKGKGREFVPIKKDSRRVFDSLGTTKIDPTIGYMVTGGRVELERNPNLGEQTLRMDLVIPFEKYDYEDEIYVPSGQDDVFFAMLDQLINGVPVKDKIND